MTTMARMDEFDCVIDARSPGEFEIDHIPGARNLPSLADDERAAIGALYQTDPHRARREGASLLAANLSRHLRAAPFADAGREWRPLVYCARGGQRSGAVVAALRRVGWRAAQLDGGYKSYRKWVGEEIARLADSLPFVVLCGRTGAGKTELLRALALAGARVLDLERIAAHRGSAFGGDGEQPPQKRFESDLAFALRACENQAAVAPPVFVESESRKIGVLHLPAPILAAMRKSPAIEIAATIEERAAHIAREYRAFAADGGKFAAATRQIEKFAGKERVESWRAMRAAGAVLPLTLDLLRSFYDPGYARSLARHYPSVDARFAQSPTDAESVRATAGAILRRFAA